MVLQSMQVERERSLVNSKSSEYDKLLQNPYTKNATPPAQLNQSPFPALNVNSPSPTPQNIGPSLFSTSSQQNPSPNLSFGVRQVSAVKLIVLLKFKQRLTYRMILTRIELPMSLF